MTANEIPCFAAIDDKRTLHEVIDYEFHTKR